MASTLSLAVSLLAAHPSLYYEPPAVPGYQAAASTTHTDIAAALEKGAAQLESLTPADLTFEPDRGGALVSLSVTCMLSADPKLCATAHSWVTQEMALVAPNGAWEAAPDFVQSNYLLGFAFAYDILSDPRLPSALSPTEQSQLQTLLAAGCAYFDGQATAGKLWYANDWTQNHNWTDYGALGVASLALLGEVPDAQTWLAHAAADYGKVAEVLARITDGTWHEGYSYEGGSVASWLFFAAAVHHAIGQNRLDPSIPDFTQTPWLSAFGHYRAVGSLPGATYQHILLHGDFFGWSNDPTLLALRYEAARFQDPEAAWLAQRQVADMPRGVYGPEQTNPALEYLVFDPTVAPATPSATDLALTDLAGFITRSGYGANATVLGLKVGAFGGLGNWNALAKGSPPGGELDFAHDHVDDLGFWLYGNGQWLAPEASGYVTHPTPDASYPLAYDTRFHNTLTVDGTGQLGDDDWCGETNLCPTIDYARQGSMVASLALPDFSFAEMEGVHLYPANLGLTGVRRQVLFVNRSTVVVRDQLDASTPHTFQWNSHAMLGAKQDGNWIEAAGQGSQELAVRVLSPAAWSFSSDVQTPQYVLAPLAPNGNSYTHYVVSNASPVASARFLVAMEPSAGGAWSSRPDLEPLDAKHPESGLVLPDGTQWILGDSPTASTSAGGLTLAGTAGAVQATAGGARYVLVRGASLQSNGTEVLSSDDADGAVEVSVANGNVDVTSTTGAHVRVLAEAVQSVTWNGSPIAFGVDPSDPRHVLISSTAGTDGGSPPGVSGGAATPGAPSTAHGGCSATGPSLWPCLGLLLLGLFRRRAALGSPK